MILPRVVGYMLGNENHVVKAGDRWLNHDARVWICLTSHLAIQIMNASNHPLNNGVHFTTIYRVHALDLECDGVPTGDMYYTNQATKIIVDGPVDHYEAPRRLAEDNLLARAAEIRGQYMKVAFNDKGGKSEKSY